MFILLIRQTISCESISFPYSFDELVRPEPVPTIAQVSFRFVDGISSASFKRKAQGAPSPPSETRSPSSAHG